MRRRFVAVAMDNGFGNCPESWEHPDSAQREVKEEKEDEAEIKQEIKAEIEEEKKIKIEEE